MKCECCGRMRRIEMWKEIAESYKDEQNKCRNLKQ